jgi:hypothetical protein
VSLESFQAARRRGAPVAARGRRVIHLKERKMTLREMIGASALALLASAACAQDSGSSATTQSRPMQDAPPAAAMPAPATTSNDPYVKKRMEDKAAKKEYKAEKKAAKSDYKQEKQQSKAKLKQDLSAQPAKPGEVGQPGQYGQSPTAAGTPGK